MACCSGPGHQSLARGRASSRSPERSLQEIHLQRASGGRPGELLPPWQPPSGHPVRASRGCFRHPSDPGRTERRPGRGGRAPDAGRHQYFVRGRGRHLGVARTTPPGPSAQSRPGRLCRRQPAPPSGTASHTSRRSRRRAERRAVGRHRPARRTSSPDLGSGSADGLGQPRTGCGRSSAFSCRPWETDACMAG